MQVPITVVLGRVVAVALREAVLVRVARPVVRWAALVVGVLGTV